MRIEFAAGMGIAVGGGLESMDESVHAAPGREVGGQRRGQRRIKQHEISLGLGTPDPELLAGWPGEDVGGGRFRSGPRRRRHHDLLQWALRQRIGSERIIHRILTGSRAAGGDLGDVQRRAAADTDHQIRTRDDLGRMPHMGDLRLAGEIGKHMRRDAFGLQLGCDAIGKARLRQETVDDDGGRLSRRTTWQRSRWFREDFRRNGFRERRRWKKPR